jgi:F-type H+-transporting ATPase subunit b
MLDLSITFFFTLINIGILFFILRAVLFKPVTKFMEARTQKIQDMIERAEKDKSQARNLLQQHRDQLKNAEAEAEAIINAARETARQQADGIIAEGRKAADLLIAGGRRQLEVERKAAMVLFKSEAAALVTAASSRLLRREITNEDTLRQAALLLREIGEN